MDYLDAIDEVLEKAASIRLPGHRLDIVTIARREFSKRGTCDVKYIDPIEETNADLKGELMYHLIERLSPARKRNETERDEHDLERGTFGKLGIAGRAGYDRFETTPVRWLHREDGWFQVVMRTRAWKAG